MMNNNIILTGGYIIMDYLCVFGREIGFDQCKNFGDALIS